MNIYQRFLKYIAIDTTSTENSLTIPSSPNQLVLAKMILTELQDLKMESFIKNGTVYGKIKANTENKKAIGFIAHLDTAPDFNGNHIHPRLIQNYNGEILRLNDNLFLDPAIFTTLQQNMHEDLIITDGTSLLGADDKAGVAIIMELVSYLTKHSEILHGDIYIAFTPDEEIGKGTDNFDFSYFAADFAYTIDGGDISIIEYETFNAASATITVVGNNIHPGSAKGKMKNAIRIAEEFDSLLPTLEKPEYTEGYDGFHHLISFSGDVEKTTLSYIIRNHDEIIFQRQKEDFQKISNNLNEKYGQNTISLAVHDSYKNMAQYIKKDTTCLEKIYAAYQALNLPYRNEPIRGGTDGAHLSEHGLLCPNLGNGGYNFHGKYEYLSLTQANQMCQILLKLCQLV